MVRWRVLMTVLLSPLLLSVVAAGDDAVVSQATVTVKDLNEAAKYAGLISGCNEIVQASSGQAVCEALTKRSGALGEKCAQKSAGKMYHPVALEVCLKLVNYWDGDDAIRCIEASADRRFNLTAIRSCLDLTPGPGSDVPWCVKMIADKEFSEPVARECAALAKTSFTETVICYRQNGHLLSADEKRCDKPATHASTKRGAKKISAPGGQGAPQSRPALPATVAK